MISRVRSVKIVFYQNPAAGSISDQGSTGYTCGELDNIYRHNLIPQVDPGDTNFDDFDTPPPPRPVKPKPVEKPKTDAPKTVVPEKKETADKKVVAKTEQKPKSEEHKPADKPKEKKRQNSTRNKISQTCRAGNVVVNGKPVKQNYRVKPGDENIFDVLPRHALHAHTLGFNIPTTKKEMFFESPMPEDMNKIILNTYLGGGTPSLLSVDEIKALLDKSAQYYDFDSEIEITLEANPDDLNASFLKELSKSGVNRLSIGTQSFFEDDLKLMNRAHTSGEAEDSIKRAQDFGLENISIDLIYGSSSMPIWKENLQKAIALQIPHISSYALTVEPKTALAKWIKMKVVKAPNEEVQTQRFIKMSEFLKNRIYSLRNIQFCKRSFVIPATANALKEVLELVRARVPVIDVINPVAEKVAYEIHTNVGVIATKATVNSGLYRKSIRKHNKFIKVDELATPLLVPAIEEGFKNHPITHAIIYNYLSNNKLKNIETLILRMYPLPVVDEENQTILVTRGKGLLDSPNIVANQ
ncbi:hypothetical protein FQR65_LT15295 [Abscondita terminalis]|nr:hypothetical protein FQR65_LT15295 [Abscondita terminalis]